LQGRIALVPAGRGGVGAGVARGLATRLYGRHRYHRDADAADGVVNAIRVAAPRRAVQQAPQNRVLVCRSRRRRRTARSGGLLVSNRGSPVTRRAVLDTPLTEFARLMDVHTFGPLALIQRLLAGMRAATGQTS